MRKRSKLLLALVAMLVATGATGIGKVLATGSPTPTPLSSYGTVTIPNPVHSNRQDGFRLCDYL